METFLKLLPFILIVTEFLRSGCIGEYKRICSLWFFYFFESDVFQKYSFPLGSRVRGRGSCREHPRRCLVILCGWKNCSVGTACCWVVVVFLFNPTHTICSFSILQFFSFHESQEKNLSHKSVMYP